MRVGGWEEAVRVEGGGGEGGSGFKMLEVCSRLVVSIHIMGTEAGTVFPQRIMSQEHCQLSSTFTLATLIRVFFPCPERFVDAHREGVSQRPESSQRVVFENGSQ